MVRIAYSGDTVFTGREELEGHAILVRDGIIEAVVPRGSIPSDYELAYVAGSSLAPGFVDLQVNGGGDVLFNASPTAQSLICIRDAHRRNGTTSIVPTFISGAPARMEEAAEAVQQVIRSGEPGILGIHFEGPLISREKGGVHDESWILDRMTRELDAVLQPPHGGKLITTVAPECVNERYIQELADRGSRVASGHTNADAKTIHRAIDAGITLGTHVYNAMAPMTSRAAGATGALLADERAFVSLICDGHHVAFDMLKIAIKAKPRGKAFFVTDAMPPVGGVHDGYTLNGENISIDSAGRCVTKSGTLAGSNLDMATAVRNAISQLNLDVGEALRMASTYPASYIGDSNSIGYLAPGYYADIVRFDRHVNIMETICRGKSIVSAPN